MLMKLSQKITMTQILAVTLIFVWGIAVELTWAQVETEEMPQKDRVNLICKKEAGREPGKESIPSPSGNPSPFQRRFYFSPPGSSSKAGY